MEFTSQDIHIIERALKVSIHHESDESKARDYREVLLKLEDSARAAMNSSVIASAKALDGIRYDYDDTTDLV
jgi:hypothetical protein